MHQKGKLQDHKRSLIVTSDRNTVEQQASTSQLKSSKVSTQENRNKYQNVDLGWYPHPKEGRPVFYNSLLPKYYETVYPYKANPQTFKKSFMKEANRQWQYHKQYEKNIGNIEFMKGENEAGAGRFLSSSTLKLRIGDGKIIHQNIEKIDTMSESCEKLRQQIEEHHTLVKGMFLIKPCKTVQRDFDLEFY